MMDETKKKEEGRRKEESVALALFFNTNFMENDNAKYKIHSLLFRILYCT